MAKTAMSKDLPSIPTPKRRRGFKNYWLDVYREMKKVEWPSVREVNRLTALVLIVCAIVVGLLSAMSLVAGTIVNLLMGKA